MVCCGRRPVRCHVSRNILSPIRNSPPTVKDPVAQYGETIETEDIYMDDVLDYAMVSNHEIALYLTDVY